MQQRDNQQAPACASEDPGEDNRQREVPGDEADHAELLNEMARNKEVRINRKFPFYHKCIFAKLDLKK